MLPWWTSLLGPLVSLLTGVALVLTTRRGQRLQAQESAASLAAQRAHRQEVVEMVIEAPAVDLTAAAEWVYVSPDQDIKSAYLHFISLAKRSIHISIFGFHIPELTDSLIEKHQAGVVVDCIFDHSQAQGKAEAVEILKLMRAGVPFLIGTSPEEGQLLHAKVTIVDEEWVEEGSWNYSESATKQFNTARITRSKQLAHIYLLARDRVRAYILRHESIFQPRAEVTPAAALAEDRGKDAELDPAPEQGQVHRKDVAAPWLDNPPLPEVKAAAGATQAAYDLITKAKPRVRKRKVKAS